tara:strand:+ start:6185 stop:6415 length:231 start_codon:yes stop_codon:yes gene_type:complete
MEENNHINKIKEDLNEYKDKYPNIVNLWEKVIKKKEDDLKKTYKQCDEMLNKINSLQKDLSMETILTLYLLKVYST